jgi:hypothetical protein
MPAVAAMPAVLGFLSSPAVIPRNTANGIQRMDQERTVSKGRLLFEHQNTGTPEHQHANRQEH